MKHKGEKYLVVTFSSPIGKKNVTTNFMKHKGEKYLVVTFSLPIGKKNVTTRYFFPLCFIRFVVTFFSL